MFCRSSAVIDHLPNISCDNQDTSAFLQAHIMSDVASLSIIKINVIHSQKSFTKKIKHFYSDDTLKILLLVIDMQESSPEVINHLRMMIEEPILVDHKFKKNVVLLLHFPPSMFSSGYYPSLFLHGWKYRYIDSLSRNAESGDIDIKFLIKKCFVDESEICPQAYDYMSFISILRHSVNNFTPLLIAGFKSNKYITERKIKYVLTNDKIITLICERFLYYLNTGICTQHLKEAAKAAYERESTINMKTHIEEKIKEMFRNFLTYIITFFHVHGIFYGLLAVDSLGKILEDFILSLIPFVPIPDMCKLTNGSSYYSLSDVQSECIYRCPYFKYIFDELEDILETSIQNVHAKNSPFGSLNDRYSMKVQKSEVLSMMMQTIDRKVREVCLIFHINFTHNYYYNFLLRGGVHLA